MSTPLVFTAKRHPNRRRIIPEDVDLVGDYLEAFKDSDDLEFTVKIEKKKKSRSKGAKDEPGNQLGFFFGTVVKIWMNEIDFTLHKYESYYNIMNLLSFEMVTDKRGKPKKKLIHVDDNMTTEQMANLISNCQIYAAQEHGVFIPDPDPRKSKKLRAQFMAQGLL